MRWADLDPESRDLVDNVLTDKQATVIKLRLNDTSWRQIAATLDITVGTAKEHYREAIRKLRKAIEEKEAA